MPNLYLLGIANHLMYGHEMDSRQIKREVAILIVHSMALDHMLSKIQWI